MRSHSAIAAALVVGLMGIACVQVYGPTSKIPMSRAMGGYQPDEIESMDVLPDSIRTAVYAYLKQRLGSDFVKKLEFTGGEIVDFDDL